MKKSIVAVLIAQEHIPFIRDWCVHHLNQGWDEIHLYDNTGSTGSLRKNTIFRSGELQKNKVNKRRTTYPKASLSLSNEDASKVLISRVSDLNVFVHEWRPVVDGRIVHHQVEAYVDYMKNNPDADWTAFIDCDEYLHTITGEWDSLIAEAEKNEVSRIILEGVRYEERSNTNGDIRNFKELKCCGAQFQAVKNIVKIRDVKKADIHWGWDVGKRKRLFPDIHQFHFKHYNFPHFGLKNRIVDNECSKNDGIRLDDI